MALFGKRNNDKEKESPTNLPKDEEKAPAQAAPEAAPAPQPTQSAQTTPDPAPTTAIPEAIPDPFLPHVEEEPQPTPASSKFHTPEGFDFNRYFLAERRIVLENISYETGKVIPGQNQYKLGVKDTIVAQIIGQAGVKINFNRALRFDPEGPFTLSVTFAVMLVFHPGTRNEIDWRTIDVAEEFKKNCPQLTQTMAAKAALLVAEITNANGGMPIIPLR